MTPVLDTGETAAPAAAVPADDDSWGEDGRYLLSLVDALRRKLTAFLEETENGDPVAAFKELALRLPGYSSRVFATVQDIRDKARWPDLTESERVSRRLVERIDLWGDDAGSTDDGDDRDGGGSASRGEPAAAGEDQEQPAPVPAEAEPARPQPPVLPRQQGDDPLRPPPEPYLRGLGRYDLIHNAARLLGPGWDLVGWSRAPGLFYVRKDGRALGWIEHGAGRVDGWAVLVDGRYLVDSTAPGRPLACDTADDAALIVRQALEQGLIDVIRRSGGS